MRTAFVAALFCGSLLQPAFAQSDSQADAFPDPASLRPAIDFWKRVYTEADTRSGFLHDNLRMDIVYEHLRFGDASSRQRRRATDAARDKYRDILTRLARGSHDSLNDEQRRVLALFPEGTTAAEFSDAATRLRFQLGQSDRFLAGLRRSERWMPHIESVMRERDLPLELAILPHVESSFQPTAYSRVGASGLWQFTRSTGLRYMRIDHIVDERRDPFLSTYAAARLLEDNYAVTQSWPLALTAYNHGLAGMRRAIDTLNTRDIGVVVTDYRGRTFGFASRNFYAAFRAALEIDREPERYFGEVDYDRPLDTSVIETTDYLNAATVARAAGLSVAELRSHNPALMDTVWEGDKLIPRGFPLRLPAHLEQQTLAALRSLPQAERFAQQFPDLQHRVARGDTLWDIARKYDVSVDSLIRANGMGSGNLIRIGQVLTLPVAGNNATLASNNTNAASAEQPEPARASQPEPPVSTAPAPVAVAATVTESEPTERVSAVTDEPAQAVEIRQASVLEPIIATGVAVLQRIADSAAMTEAAEPISIDLSADPSDYSVADDGTIEVQALETLGHYADWLEIRTQALRDINGLPFERAVHFGERIRLRFDTIDRATFEQRRMQYQQQIQEDFFTEFHISDVTEHVVRPGESLWILANRRYNVPVWLLRQYNPDVDLDRISPGTVVKFPSLRRIADDA